MNGRISEAVLEMRFYEVSDEHQSDIKKACRVSEPIFQKIVNLRANWL
jgi:hypothetical protein